MSSLIQRTSARRRATPIEPVTAASLPRVLKRLDAAQRRWTQAQDFSGAAGSHVLLPDAAGKLARVLVGVHEGEATAALGGLPCALPPGTYVLDAQETVLDPQLLALGWALGAYRYGRYRQPPRPPATLAVPAQDLAAVTPLVETTALVRDLVNTPTADMGPEDLAAAMTRLAKLHKAKRRDWVGDELLQANFPTIHAVGRASPRAPRLLELTWGKPEHPRLVVAGKGVCFDTGGLDLKSADGMRWMKKDMGGAAHAIALASLIMQSRLPVQLTLLVPAVENSVAGNALRPGDVITTRAGHTVEVDNTDAEGRLVLCDALAYGAEQTPDLMLDFATLTGAARVALGPDLPALFATSDTLAAAVLAAGREVHDPLWQLPLWQPYRRMLDSYLADFTNSSASRHGGAITAALYLQRFVPEGIPWLHLDTYAWNDSDRPGRPRGGEAMGLRAIFAYLQQRYR